MSGVENRTNLVWVCVGQVLAAVILIVASTSMTWATYRDLSTNETTAFHGGRLSILLVALGVASVALSLRLLAGTTAAFWRLHVVVGGAALVASIVQALDKISTANHLPALGPSQTSYALGAGLAVVASAALALTCLVALGQTRGTAAPGGY
jgi:hypothetical protein